MSPVETNTIIILRKLLHYWRH